MSHLTASIAVYFLVKSNRGLKKKVSDNYGPMENQSAAIPSTVFLKKLLTFFFFFSNNLFSRWNCNSYPMGASDDIRCHGTHGTFHPK